MLRIAPIRNPTKTYADGWEVGAIAVYFMYLVEWRQLPTLYRHIYFVEKSHILVYYGVGLVFI